MIAMLNCTVVQCACSDGTKKEGITFVTPSPVELILFGAKWHCNKI